MKVVKIDDELVFDNGWSLYSAHYQDCCEHHWICFNDLTLSDFDELEFDLTDDRFFTPISGYGIALNPINGWPVRIPGYGSNNGYYGSNIELVVADENGRVLKSFDVSECQDY